MIDDPRAYQSYALTLTWSLSKLTVIRADGTPTNIGVGPKLRRSLKERAVTCKTADGSAVLFRAQSRGNLTDDVIDAFDVSDGNGVGLGLITRPLRVSDPGSYVIETAAGRWTLTEAREKSPKSLLRGVALLVATVSSLASPNPQALPLREQFALFNESGVQVGSACLSHRGLKVVFEISIGDDRLDMRVATAIGVATVLATYPT